MVTYHGDKSRLSCEMQDALECIVEEFQAVCNDDIDFYVFPVDFPFEFCIRTSFCDSFVSWKPLTLRFDEISGTQVQRKELE